MKEKRHKKILSLIKHHPIGTQDELLTYLKEDGFIVTQATVSRDIKELCLMKTTVGNAYRYVSGNGKNESMKLANKFRFIFKESVIDINYAGNIIMVHCFSGMANAACATIDSIKWEGLIGTLAGDDTFIMLAENEGYAKKLTKEFKEVLESKL